MEREAKFRIDDPVLFEQLQALDTLAGYELTHTGADQQHNVYYDTPDGQLQRHRYALRVRQTGQQRILTLKGDAQVSNGMHEREEIEAELGDSDLQRICREGQIGTLIGDLVGAAPNLTPLFSIDTTRRRILVGPEQAPVVELALDYATLMAGSRRQEFYELEAELLEHGTDQDLQAVVQALQTNWPLTPEDQTKYERGLALRDQAHPEGDGSPLATTPAEESPSAKKASPKTGTVTREDDVAEAVRKMLAQQVRKLHKHEDGVRANSDIEAVHQMRVATRRMRAVLALTEGIFKRKATTLFTPMLRKLARALGAVRDRDVFIEDLEAFRASLPESLQADLDELVSRLRDEQQAAHTVLVEVLDSKKFRAAERALTTFAQTPGMGVVPRTAREHEVIARQVRHRAGSAIWSRYEDIRAYETALPDAPAETLHRLRIAGKRLRYTLELFEDALEGSRYTDVRNRLAELQDHLGALQDAEVSMAYVRAIVNDQPAEGLSRYIADREQRHERLLADFPKVWAKINSLTFRRRLSDVITQL